MTQGPAEQVGTSVDMLRNPRGNNEELSLARFLEPERLDAIRAIISRQVPVQYSLESQIGVLSPLKAKFCLESCLDAICAIISSKTL